MAGVEHVNGAVILEGKDERSVQWEPGRLAARSGGVEIYRVERM